MVDAQPGAASQAVVRQEPTGELGSSIRVLAADVQRVGRARRDAKRWRRGSSADATKPPPEPTAKIEHSEVQAC
jgi:hypothetical protein